MDIIINSPSLDPNVNVSGISSVVNFIIQKNKDCRYIHFEDGSRDNDSKTLRSRFCRIMKSIKSWSILLEQNESAIIHFNLPLMSGAIIRDYFLLRIAHKKERKVILHLHGGSLLKVHKRPWILNLLLKKIFSWSKSIITLSEEEKKVIIDDFCINNVCSLPNCIDLNNAKSFTRSFNSSETLNLLYLGRIEKNKGIDYIFQASKKLKDLQIDFCLHFAGKEENEGEFIPKMAQILGDKFQYHGIVSGKQKENLLKDCDIFLLPSMYEGLPMSLIETMSYGQIPIVTNVGSISLVVQNNENGFFVNKCCVEDIVEKILIVLKNESLRNRMSNSAQQRIFSLFDDERYIAQLNRLYLK